MISYIEYISGCMGGMAGVFVGQPLDTIKVRLQTQSSGTTAYRGVWHCFTSIIKNESVNGLFKGMSSPLIGLSFINAIIFGIEAQSTAILQSQTTFAHFLGGAFAGSVQCIICSPMELAKTQMQVQGIGTRDRTKVLYKNSVDCLIKINRKHGMKGVYKGMTLTLLRETPAFGCYFATYDVLTTRFFKLNKDESYQWTCIGKMMFAGGIAGIMAWIVTYPFDVIKSRLQADTFDPKARKYTGTLDCLKKSLNNHGYRIFFRGLNSTLIRAFPVNATTFAVVQVTSQQLYERRKQRMTS